MRQSSIRILLILYFFGVPLTAHALTCGTQRFTLEEAYDAADSIIVGIVSDCREATSSDSYISGGLGCAFTSLEVLKESTPPRDYGSVASSSVCGLSFHVGNQYLLFLDGDNQPMHFSASLTGERYQVELATNYLQILREFRDGVSDDLAEPWIFGAHRGQCSIGQSVNGHRISVKGGSPDAPQFPHPEWIEDSISGHTVFKATVPTFDEDMRVTTETAEVVAFGTPPDFGNDVLELQVSFEEERPAPLRQATLSVGHRTWPLTRMEAALTHRGEDIHTFIYYFAAGNVVEDILSAMVRPSDIVVTATILANESSPVEAGASPNNLTPFSVPADKGRDLRQTDPGITFNRPSGLTTPRSPAAGPYRGDQPKPVLRLESRSTQLARVIESFRACQERESE